MSTAIEKRMIAAHKEGVKAFKIYGSLADMSVIIRKARQLYTYEHQREAFTAGYIGEQRRQVERR